MHLYSLLRTILPALLLCCSPLLWAQTDTRTTDARPTENRTTENRPTEDRPTENRPDADALPRLNLELPLRPIFAGSWERDFLRSDSWDTELERLLLIREEALERMRRQSSADIALGQVPSGLGGGGRRGGANVVDLARLAEYISRQTTLTITQTRSEVRIAREGDATLICGVEDGAMPSFSSTHGSEICGWDRNQLVFQTRLPDDLVIMHRFSVSSDGKLLSMVISISSRGGEPFNLRQSFNRYEAPAEEFDCELTISRGRVCNQTSRSR